MAKYSVFQVNVGENQEKNQWHQQHPSASFDLNQNENKTLLFDDHLSIQILAQSEERTMYEQ